MVLVALLPSLGLLLNGAWANRQLIMDASADRAIRIAAMASEEQQRHILSGRQVLFSLSHLRPVRRQDSAACSALLADMAPRLKGVVRIGAADAQGRSFCSSSRASPGHYVGDSDWFISARKSADFAIGRIERDPVSGALTLPIALPVLNGFGQVDGVVSMSLGLDWLARFAENRSLPVGMSVTVRDQNGRQLLHYPQALPASALHRHDERDTLTSGSSQKFVGLPATATDYRADGTEQQTSMAQAPLVPLPGEAHLPHSGGGHATPAGIAARSATMIAVDIDGIERLFASGVLVDDILSVTVGLPTDLIVSNVQEALERDILLLALAGLLALTLAWFGGDRLIVRPIAGLRGAARRLQAGNLAARAAGGGCDELGELSATFNSMAQTLADRESALRESEERFRRLTSASFEGILIHDQGRIIDANESLAQLTGYALNDLVGGDFRDIVIDEEGHELMCHLVEHPEIPLEAMARRGDGSRLPIEIISRAFPSDGRQLGVVAVRDISERVRGRRELEQLAFYDGLTGLSNRTRFVRRLDEAIAATDDAVGIAVLLINLDRFHHINDTLGHDLGDRLLGAVARQLEKALRAGDELARLGGDEFAIIQTDTSSATDAAILADRLLAALTTPLTVDNHELHIGACIGIALCPRDGRSRVELLRHADLALHRAKSLGRNGYAFFTGDMNRQIQARKSIEDDLRQAMRAGELTLHYQPQYAVADQALVGAEALLRWPHPHRGAVAPAEFIPVAEASGLIVPLGRWVLHESCRQLAAWCREGLVVERLAVNISAAQFRDQTIVHQVRDVLAEFDLPPDLLTLELTESVFVDHDLGNLHTLLTALRQEGIDLALDDFGTGYSSLSYLRRFPFNHLKIDRSFMQEFGQESDAAPIIETIIRLGHNLGMTVLAEGVETAEQLEFLKAQGCDNVQGYFLGRPMPADQFAALLRRQEPARVISANFAHA